MREIDTIEEFDAHVGRSGSLDDVVVQGIDLTSRSDLIRSLSCRGATFLGTAMSRDAAAHALDTGAVVFPRLPDLPFDTYRPRLYAQDELLAGWVPGAPGSFVRDALDSRDLPVGLARCRGAGRPPCSTRSPAGSTIMRSTTPSASICDPTPTWSP